MMSTTSSTLPPCLGLESCGLRALMLQSQYAFKGSKGAAMKRMAWRRWPLQGAPCLRGFPKLCMIRRPGEPGMGRLLSYTRWGLRVCNSVRRGGKYIKSHLVMAVNWL